MRNRSSSPCRSILFKRLIFSYGKQSGFSFFLRIKRKFFMLFTIAALIALLVNFAPQKFFDEIKSIEQGTKEATAQSRMRFWRRAWRMFLDKPLFRHGIGQFPEENGRYRLPWEEDKVTDTLVCHSNWFQVLSELGLTGPNCYLIIWLKYLQTWKLTN